MAMKLSEQMRKSMDDAEDGLSFSFPVDAWANEVAQLEEGLLKYKDIAHNINESFQLERTESAALKQEIVNAISIMDEKGRKNQEGNSTMLWNKDWGQLRFILFALLGETND